MLDRVARLTIPAALCIASGAQAQLDLSPPEPKAPKRVHVREVHGERFEDPYFWLRQRGDPEVLAFLKACNAHADAVMRPTAGLQKTLYREILSRIQEADLSVPVFDRGYWYYERTEKGKQYEIYCRRRGSMRAKEEVLLDVNRLAKSKPFMSIGDFEVSPSGRLLAYSTDETGSRDYTVWIKDLRTGRLLPDRLGTASSLVWAEDSKTLFYTMDNASKRSYRLFRRALGERRPTLLYEERDPQFDLYLSADRDHRFGYATSVSKETSECRSIDLRNSSAPPKLMDPRREGVEYYPTHHAGSFIIRTNDNAPEFKLVAAPVSSPGHQTWKTILTPAQGETIEGVEIFRRTTIVQVRRRAIATLRVCQLANGSTHTIAFPDPFYSAGVAANPDFDPPKIRLAYVSQVTPQTVYDYDPEARSLTKLKRQVVKGYDGSKYASELLWLPARDGEMIPVAVAYRKEVAKPAPMLLEAYGAYGLPNDPYFSVAQLSLMDRGFVLGSALVRGGGEMGERWHDAGKMQTKLNTFTDFIDCARHLEHLGWTSADKLAITGGSAGGLTMGAVLNMAPEIARAALVEVPFVDVINTMLDETIPLTTQEFIEWGNPKVEEQYRWIRGYSPYDNVGALDYPAMLVRTSLNDSNVPYWEAAKWVARLRELHTDDDPILLKINMDSGHGGASGRYDAIHDRAFDFAFLLTILGGDKP